MRALSAAGRSCLAGNQSHLQTQGEKKESCVAQLISLLQSHDNTAKTRQEESASLNRLHSLPSDTLFEKVSITVSETVHDFNSGLLDGIVPQQRGRTLYAPMRKL